MQNQSKLEQIILFDFNHNHLKPLTYTRSVIDLRIGILTIKEKWELYLKKPISCITADYLQDKYDCHFAQSNIFINSSILPNEKIIHELIPSLKPGHLYTYRDQPAFFTGSHTDYIRIQEKNYTGFECIKLDKIKINFIQYTWELFGSNDTEIRADFRQLTHGKTSASIGSDNHFKGKKEDIFVESGASIDFSILNASTGPIYIGKNASIMEGSLIRGPFALCENATLKMGAKIYGATTIGPHSKIGGEVNNSIITGYSNKGHEGFLGNAVIGEWCNLGADTNNSNLKNNYSEIRQWNYVHKSFIRTGLQFSGLIMGDHSKTAINTMFNTGTVVGVSSNIYGAEFPRKFVPSFSWGSSKGFSIYKLDQALETANRVMQRRNLALSDYDVRVLEHVFEDSAKFRKFT